MLLGALVAGLHAGLVYNTWPSMDGRIFPEGAFVLQPGWINFFENPGLAQFDHRVGAYVVLSGALLLWWRSRAPSLSSPGFVKRNPGHPGSAADEQPGWPAVAGHDSLKSTPRLSELRGVRRSADAVLAVTFAQVALGIATLLDQAPLLLAALHQATAVALFSVALWHAFECHILQMSVIPDSERPARA
jgi:cytochrome c oxidase assembly protein subunit 15